MSIGVWLVLSVFGATTETSTVPRTLGERGESCRAALDCRPELRCIEQVCIEPKARASAPTNSLRVGAELAAGPGWTQTSETLVVSGSDETADSFELAARSVGFVEVALSQEQLLLAVYSGLDYPSGFSAEGPVIPVGLRSGWQVWTEGPSRLYLESAVEGLFGDIPSAGIGGALGTRYRLNWFDAGLRVGGWYGGRGRVSTNALLVDREQTGFTVSLFFAVHALAARF